jgi:hypothetical protein
VRNGFDAKRLCWVDGDVTVTHAAWKGLKDEARAMWTQKIEAQWIEV